MELLNWGPNLYPYSIMSKSARKTLTGEKSVHVLNFMPVTPLLGVLSYKEGDVRYDDIYNIPSSDVMHTLERVSETPGQEVKVDAVIKPDTSADQDTHPECIAAVVVA